MENLSKGAIQAGLAVDLARRLESALAAAGATGKGLHEKVGSVERQLPAALVARLRFIASVRNKIVHEDELLSDDEIAAFTEAGRQALAALGALAGAEKPQRPARARPPGKARKTPPAEARWPAVGGAALRLGGALALAGLAPVFLLMLLGNDGPPLRAGAFAIYLLLGRYFLKRLRRARPAGK